MCLYSLTKSRPQMVFNHLLFFCMLLSDFFLLFFISSNFDQVACMLSCVQLFATWWAVAHHAPLCMQFLWQEYWSGLPFPPPGDLLDPGIEPVCLVSPALANRFFTTAWPDLKMPSFYFKFFFKIIMHCLFRAGDRQGSLVCCSLWGCRELDKTERLNWTDLSFWRRELYFRYKCKFVWELLAKLLMKFIG